MCTQQQQKLCNNEHICEQNWNTLKERWNAVQHTAIYFMQVMTNSKPSASYFRVSLSLLFRFKRNNFS